MLKHLINFFVGLVGTSVVVVLTTVYVWVLVTISKSTWAYLDGLVQ